MSHENAKSNATSAKCLIRKEELSRFYSVIGNFFQIIYKFEKVFKDSPNEFYLFKRFVDCMIHAWDLKMCQSMVMNLVNMPYYPKLVAKINV